VTILLNQEFIGVPQVYEGALTVNIAFRYTTYFFMDAINEGGRKFQKDQLQYSIIRSLL
jgi:hypothetical protein